MLKFVRCKFVDYVDKDLDDVTLGETLLEGSWIMPLQSVAGVVKWGIPASFDGTDVACKLARPVFMEPGRTDVKAVGKTTVLQGHIILRTDAFITGDCIFYFPSFLFIEANYNNSGSHGCQFKCQDASKDTFATCYNNYLFINVEFAGQAGHSVIGFNIRLLSSVCRVLLLRAVISKGLTLDPTS